MAKWGTLKAFDNWNKIERAVRETEGIIILYDKKVVNPVFHANSGGMTENSEDVWEGVEVPYLKSVKSEGEDESPGYKVQTVFKEEEITKKLKEQYPDMDIEPENVLDEIEILERTQAGRVKEMKIEDVVIKGTELLRLKTHFSNGPKAAFPGAKATSLPPLYIIKIFSSIPSILI